MHSIAFFLCSSWSWTFFYDFFFLKTVPALMCLCRVSRFDIKRSFLLPPCLVYFWVGPQLLDCCSNNARFRAQLQVRLPATAHKEKQYHNMLETGHAFRGWYSVVVRILHGCEDRMMLPRIGGFLIWIGCPLGRKILQGTHQRWLGRLPRQRIVFHGSVLVIPL